LIRERSKEAYYIIVQSGDYNLDLFVDAVMGFGNFKQHLPQDLDIFSFIPNENVVEEFVKHLAINPNLVSTLKGYDKFVYDHRDKWVTLKTRLKGCMLLEKLDHLNGCVDYCSEVIRVIKETLNSPYFHKFLEIILAIGNFGNKYPVRGFDLRFLFDMNRFILNDGTSLLSYCKHLFKQLYPGQTIILFHNVPNSNLTFEGAIGDINHCKNVDRKLGEDFVQRFHKVTSADFSKDLALIGKMIFSNLYHSEFEVGLADEMFKLFTGKYDLLLL